MLDIADGASVAGYKFKPHYVPTERGADVLKRLAGLVIGAEAVFLATDPDREGEAIAWHLAEALKLKNARCITYAEITETAIKAALTAPRDIDMALVAAQEGRRVLDRFCGYMVSSPLSECCARSATERHQDRQKKPCAHALGGKSDGRPGRTFQLCELRVHQGQ